MKRYSVALLLLTLMLVAAAFCTLWCGCTAFQPAMAVLPLYFAVVTALMHYAVVKSFYKDPRTFVKNFLGLTVGSLILHLAVVCIWSFTHIATAKAFIIAFAIGYIAYLTFETIALVMLIKRKRDENQQ